MKLYRKTIFFGLIFTMLMVQSEAMAPTLQDQMVDLHVNLEQLKKQLTGLKDGLDTVTRRLKGEVDDEKGEEKEEEKEEPLKHKAAVQELIAQEINNEPLKTKFSDILNEIANIQNDNADLFEKLKSQETETETETEKINVNAPEDAARFGCVVTFLDEINRLIPDFNFKKMTGNDLAKILEACDRYLHTIINGAPKPTEVEGYKDLNIFENIPEDMNNVTQKEFSSFTSNDLNNFKIFTRAKARDNAAFVETAFEKAKKLMKNQGFWYNYNFDHTYSKEAAQAGGRIIDFYRWKLGQIIQDDPSTLGTEFEALSKGFCLRTQAAAALYPFLFYNYKNPTFLETAVTILLGVCGQKSHSLDYFAYKWLSNPSIHMILEKIANGTYGADELTAIKKICESYANKYINNYWYVTIPTYGSRHSIPSKEKIDLKYTHQGMRVQKEILTAIYARHIKDLIASINLIDPRDALIEEITKIYKQQEDEEIKKRERTRNDEKKAIEEEIKKIEDEILQKEKEIETERNKIKDTKGKEEANQKEISTKIEEIKKQLQEKESDRDAKKAEAQKEFDEKKETLEQSKKEKLTKEELEKRARQKIAQQEAGKISAGVKKVNDIYLKEVLNELNIVIAELVDKNKTITQEIINNLKDIKSLSKRTLEDFWGTLLFIVNDYKKGHRESTNKTLIPQIIRAVEKVINHTLANKESMRVLCTRMRSGQTVIKEISGEYVIHKKVAFKIEHYDLGDLQDIEKLAMLIGRLIDIDDSIITEGADDSYVRLITTGEAVVRKCTTYTIKLSDDIPNLVPYYLLIRGGIYDPKEEITQKILAFVTEKTTIAGGEEATLFAHRYWQSAGAIPVPMIAGASKSKQDEDREQRANERLVKAIEEVKIEIEEEYKQHIANIEQEKIAGEQKAREVFEQDKKALDEQIEEKIKKLADLSSDNEEAKRALAQIEPLQKKITQLNEQVFEKRQELTYHFEENNTIFSGIRQDWTEKRDTLRILTREKLQAELKILQEK